MVSSAIGILLFAGLCVWAVSVPATVRFVVEGILWLIAALVSVEIISGLVWLLTRLPLLPEFHRWTAHLLVLLCGVVMAASIALLLRFFRRRLGTVLLLCLISLGAMAVISLASFTGYLRPFAPGTQKETRSRFLMLHCVTLPIVLAAIVPFWISTVRRLRPAAAKRSSRNETAGDGDNSEAPAAGRHAQNDNPYASPSD